MSPKGQPRKGVNVKTTVDLPEALWRATKVQAIEEGTDLRRVIMTALNQYLKRKPPKEEE